MEAENILLFVNVARIVLSSTYIQIAGIKPSARDTFYGYWYCSVILSEISVELDRMQNISKKSYE